MSLPMTDKKGELLTDGEMEFHFEKSNFFRVIHVDGAFGGISPGTQMATAHSKKGCPKNTARNAGRRDFGKT